MASQDSADDKCQNFLRQFRDKDTKQLKKFTAQQFQEVWNHYDTDGELHVEYRSLGPNEVLVICNGESR
jgi:hypothetical protein